MKQSLQLSFVLFAASVGCCCRKWGKSPGEFGDRLYRSVIGRQKMAEFRALRSGFERMLASMAFMPLVGLEPNEEVARIITVVVLLIQAVLAIASTRIVGMLNVCAVGVEVAIIGVLVVALTIAVLITRLGSTANLTARGITANAPGYFAVGGGLTIAMIMGLATLVGFDAAANLAEEAKDPYRNVPRVIVGSVLAAGLLGLLFLIALTVAIPDVTRLSHDPSPVATILREQLGHVVEVALLAAITFIFRLRDGDDGDRRTAGLCDVARLALPGAPANTTLAL